MKRTKRQKIVLWVLVVGKRSQGHASYISTSFKTRQEGRDYIKNHPQRIPCAWHIAKLEGMI